MVTRRQVLAGFGQTAIAGAVLGALAACAPAVPGAAPTAASRSALSNPVIGLYSKTDASQGTSLTQRITDTVVGIAYGRQSIGALDQVVKDWRANGGDQIRSEYEAALQAAA
jgi:hypothetical protein